MTVFDGKISTCEWEDWPFFALFLSPVLAGILFLLIVWITT